MSFIGLIADTHNLVRPEALEALAGALQILHAGDICDPEILEQLGRIAPVTAVRGNCDRLSPRWSLPQTITVEIDGLRIHVIHDVQQIDLDPAAAGIDVVLSGHSHKPLVQKSGGVLYVNPGSAGPRRFKPPVSLARLRIRGNKPRVEIIPL